MATETMTTAGALFSDDRKHRLILWRRWNQHGERYALCIGLNPSTANETTNDRTIQFLVKLLMLKGYDGLIMCNLFSNITSKPTELPEHPTEQAVQTIIEQAKRASDIFFCWGAFKQAQVAASKIISLFPDAKCLDRNVDTTRTPKHPAWYVRNGYVKDSDMALIPMKRFIALRK